MGSSGTLECRHACSCSFAALQPPVLLAACSAVRSCAALLPALQQDYIRSLSLAAPWLCNSFCRCRETALLALTMHFPLHALRDVIVDA